MSPPAPSRGLFSATLQCKQRSDLFLSSNHHPWLFSLMLQFSPFPLSPGSEGNSLISACFVLVSHTAECLEVSLLLPPFQLSVSLHHFVTLSCLLVSASLLLLPSWSIRHFSSVVLAPFSPTSTVSCFSLLSLVRFSPLVSELLSLIPPASTSHPL